MPDFWPYLIFCLYLSRMQKYAFFPVCANIPGEILLPPAFFLIKIQATEETKSSQLRKSQKKAVSLHWHI